jgi:hypothetical protein
MSDEIVLSENITKRERSDLPLSVMEEWKDRGRTDDQSREAKAGDFALPKLSLAMEFRGIIQLRESGAEDLPEANSHSEVREFTNLQEAMPAADENEEIRELIEDAVKSAEPKLKEAIVRANAHLTKVRREVLPGILKNEKELTEIAEAVKAAWTVVQARIEKGNRYNRVSYSDYVHRRIDLILRNPNVQKIRDAELELYDVDPHLSELVGKLQKAIRTDRSLKTQLGMDKWADALKLCTATEHAYGKLLKIAGREEEGDKLLKKSWSEKLRVSPDNLLRLRPWRSVNDLKHDSES